MIKKAVATTYFFIFLIVIFVNMVIYNQNTYFIENKSSFGSDKKISDHFEMTYQENIAKYTFKVY